MNTNTNPVIEVHRSDCDVCNGVPQLDRMTTTVQYLCLEHKNQSRHAEAMHAGDYGDFHE